MLPFVCNDAAAILFMFDLSRKTTLNSIKEWYRQARGFNKVFIIIINSQCPFFNLFYSNNRVLQSAIPFLIGTKFDQFSTLPVEEQAEITEQARKFARAMKVSF